MKCPNCGNMTQEDALFCDQCGTRLPKEAPVAAPIGPAQTPAAAPPTVSPGAPSAPAAQGAQCPHCGALNTPGEMFCSECGTPLAAPEPEQMAAPQTTAETPSSAPPPSAPPSTAQATCPMCGAQVSASDRYCFACGADLLTVTTAAAAVTTAAEPLTTAPAAAPPSALRECPACGAQVSPGDAFCEFCGAALTAPEPEPPSAPGTAAPSAPAQPPIAGPGPRLVVADSGVEIPLPAQGEIVVGREDPYSGVFPDVDLTPHGGEEGGVSRRHFRLARSGERYTIEDLNSTNFTLLNRAQLQPGQPMPLSDGDEIRAGRVRLIFRTG